MVSTVKVDIMKNIFYFFLALILTSSCVTLRQNSDYYTPYTYITDTLDHISFKPKNRQVLNSEVCEEYWQQAETLKEFMSCEVVTLPRLNAWASKAVGDVLKNKPFAAQISDAIGMTRFAKTMSEGNTHIFVYATAMWNEFIQYFQTYPNAEFDSFWIHLTSVYPELLTPAPKQINPQDGKHYNYRSLLQYYKAMQLKDNATKKNELILLGNLYFILGEQTLAQTYISKALSFFRFGCNPLNIPGRQVKAQVGSTVYANTEIIAQLELNFNNTELNELIAKYPVTDRTVQYHKYDNRMPYLFNLAIMSHHDPTAFDKEIFDSL